MLQLKPNQWSCSITALAMTLRVPVADLVSQLGHDGSEIIFPNLDEPMCRRGFHSQELIHLAWLWNFAVTPFEALPVISPTCGNEGMVPVIFDGDEDSNWTRFNDIIGSTRGILEGRTTASRHAVHYNYDEIWDPDGCQYPNTREACEQRGFYGNRAFAFVRRT